MELLMNYDWPGNIRELANLARKIVALGETKFAIAEISYGSSPRQRTVGLQSQSLKAAARSASRMAERDLIMKALEKTHWNRKQAAKQLQISYKALLYKIKQMDVPKAELQNEGEDR
jgi:two-component system response regulator AtoC